MLWPQCHAPPGIHAAHPGKLSCPGQNDRGGWVKRIAVINYLNEYPWRLGMSVCLLACVFFFFFCKSASLLVTLSCQHSDY